ncbi:hypothetical protein LSH36_817g00022 [Paralvinella palmiformis]|uniref:Uncharacterized protein n=1 Tax=Paralvinella palmiformis TaxID=53620 RepID=A0AAD9J0D1_9ANNE|nr:hypothetical protein LSH36_817g00022 [Paralvinella palmiformis]
MAADCAVELKNHDVSMVSLWPGLVNTEVVSSRMSTDSFGTVSYFQPGIGQMSGDKLRQSFSEGESAEFAGMCIVALSKDPQLMKKSGKILMTGDLAAEYDLKDLDATMAKLKWGAELNISTIYKSSGETMQCTQATTTSE